MFLPQSCLVNLTLEASFEGLERCLEQLLGQIFGREGSLKRDDTYQLLWELGSNVLKYGIKTKPSAKIDINSSKKYGKNLIAKSRQNLDSTKIYMRAFVCDEFIQISLHYLVGKNLASLKSSQNNNALATILAPIQMLQVPRVYALHYDELKSAKNLPTKNLSAKKLPAKNLSAKSNDLDCQNLLGNKVIAYLVDKICYDTPKIFLPNARERTLRVRLKPLNPKITKGTNAW
ncbi:hypothetical protein HMPREF2086_01714 [Helicobacter macacae MIT 99-5501]|uniref:Uncharacterized protein n=1 Tax=Helicobacter macacae MIT 99-5501 TaxID=1357400 RepID=V8C676_9HELI|nr:hypothetical protein HMPREF2086_01714 [Helicobacter macacae MIT 99-5501]